MGMCGGSEPELDRRRSTCSISAPRLRVAFGTAIVLNAGAGFVLSVRSMRPHQKFKG